MTPPDLTAKEAPPRPGHVPGEVGIWVLILVDMTVFALIFGYVIVDRAHARDLFAASAAKLTAGFGIANTLLLLTSSLFVALGVQAVRTERSPSAARLFGGALLCALGFVGNKAAEYSIEISRGLTPWTNNFFMYFYIVTAMHLLHVVIGAAVLKYLRGRARADPVTCSNAAFETGATFWHMVDLLWVVIFALFYVTRL